MNRDKNDSDQKARNQDEEFEKNKNTTLADPGAPVNDYGRASDGLMEQQENEWKTEDSPKDPNKR